MFYVGRSLGFLSRSVFALVLGATLVVSTACQAQTEGAQSPGGPRPAQVATPSDLETSDSALVGAMDGFQTRTMVDEIRHIHATWPQIPGATTLNESLTTTRSQLIDRFRADYSPPSPGQVAVPELNATWRLVGASNDVVGVVSDDFLNAGASASQSWLTTWYDRRSGTVVANLALLGDQEEVRSQIISALANQTGVFPDELANAVASDDIPVVGFTASGDLLIGFDEYQVGAGALGQVAVSIPLEDRDPLLSDFGRRARAAVLEPDVPGPAASPPAPEPAQPTTEPAVNCRNTKCVAITYDDGPASHTEALLDTLQQRKATATFFALGQQVATYPATTSRIVNEGHELGVHTWDHKNLTQLAPADIHAQIDRTVQEIQTTTGLVPHLLRPPYGASNTAVEEQARETGLAIAMWSVDTEDWRDRNTSIVVQRAINQARRGSIILMHDIHDTTVAGAAQIIDGLRDRGFTLVTVSELLGNPLPGSTYRSQP